MTEPIFVCELPVRVGDLAGGVHVGNQTLLAYINEAQMQCFVALGFPSLTVDGCMPIMRHLDMDFRAEARYGETLHVHLRVTDIGERDYRLQAELVSQPAGRIVAAANLRMKFIDLQSGRSVAVPAAFAAACRNWQGA